MKVVKTLFSYIFKTKKNGDTLISFLVYFLLALGLLFSTSASMDTTTTIKTTLTSLIKQGIIISLAIVVYHFVSNSFNFSFTEKVIDKIICFEFVLLLGAVAWCSFNGSINGSYAWIYIGPFSLQPAEFAKICMILLVATKLCDKSFNAVKKPWHIVMKPFMYLSFYLITVFFFQKDKGSALIIAIVFYFCFMIPSSKKIKKYQSFLTLIVVISFVAFFMLLSDKGIEFLRAINLDTVANRFEAVKNPSYSSDGTREIFYSLLGISKGGIFGVGLGDSVQKFGYLVSSNADYVFSIIVEETGLLGIFLVFAPYLLLIGRLMYYAKRVNKESDKVILIGTVSYLFIHLLLNVGGVSGLLPLTGVPLLFLSSGGSATLSIMIALGISQSVIGKHNSKKEIGQF